ncbi:MAG TPA: alginate lyase family protein [Steroidobacteraceae bacterium]|nr:alginate lyase family protein [Steroidobacteraceae bacterium]
MQAARLFHTVRHLRATQIRHQLLNRVLSPARVRVAASVVRTRADLRPVPYITGACGAVSTGLTFRFLNESRSTLGPIDWASPAMSRLWRYNLHYFDYLLDDALPHAVKTRLIDDWIQKNPPGDSEGWEPYPLSLRIVNWIKYCLQHGVDSVPQRWLASLYAQTQCLERRIEYHLLGNHLLKNAVALLFAGMFFAGDSAERWLRRATRLLGEEVTEQFLSDGGHYERSPMYHAICTLDLLDVIAMISQPGLGDRLQLGEQLRDTARRALDFLEDVSFPDGQIALFNDSAFGIAPQPAAIVAHGASVLGWRPRRPLAQLHLIDRAASGYFGVRQGGDMLLVDCGEIGPSYQPGHAHCDTLSYELVLNGDRVIVDSGVHDYEAGPLRTHARSTAGHNTVQIDGAEQSEIWGVFRVARRARPLAAALTANGNEWQFEGSHDGYRRLPGQPVHRRRIVGRGTSVIEVEDLIEGRGDHSAESRIRLHPRYKSVMCGGYARIVEHGGRCVARIEFAGGVPDVEPARYFPEFGRELACECIVLSCAGVLPLRFGYRIFKEA